MNTPAICLLASSILLLAAAATVFALSDPGRQILGLAPAAPREPFAIPEPICVDVYGMPVTIRARPMPGAGTYPVVGGTCELLAIDGRPTNPHPTIIIDRPGDLEAGSVHEFHGVEYARPHGSSGPVPQGIQEVRAQFGFGYSRCFHILGFKLQGNE